MAHPYGSHKSLHTERLGKMLGGSEREKGPKAKHEHLTAAKRGGAMKGEMGMHGAKAKHANRYKKGGRVKGKTHININVMPNGAQAPAGGLPTLPAGLGAAAMPPPVIPKPPMAPPPMAGGAPGMPPGGPAMPPMMRKRGGAAYKAGGKVSDEKQDKRDMAAAVHKHERHMHKGEKETAFKSGGKVQRRDAGGAVSAADFKAAREDIAAVRPRDNVENKAPNSKARNPDNYSRGGRANGPAWAEGMRNGTKTQHAKQGRGVTQDSGDTHRRPVITKKAGGAVGEFSEKMNMAKMSPNKNFSDIKRASQSGGNFSEHVKMKDIKNAAGGGLGRLEKIKLQGGTIKHAR